MSVTFPEGVAVWCIIGTVAWLPFGIILSFAATASPRSSELSGLSCPGDQVVWINTRTGIYHLQGERWFGRTRQGKYACEKAADAEGDRETRNGQ